MKRDQQIIKKRKRIWDIMGYGYKTPNQLLKNHSLNCGCNQCRMRTFLKKKERRDNRHRDKITLKFEE